MATDTSAIPAPTMNGSERTRRSSFREAKPKVLRPFDTAEVKILLLENVNETAVKSFQKQGYQVNIIYKEIYICHIINMYTWLECI